MLEELMHKPSQVISKSYVNNEYYLYLHGDIGSPDNFLEHFVLYRTASQQDIIFLYVNSNGGSLATGMEYIRHMRECEAPITCVLGMEVASMASAIALEATDLVIDEMSTMLIHSFSYGAMGTEYSIYNQATFNKRLNERWMKSHYSIFLDDQQLCDALKGVDILLDSDEIKERWGKLKAFRDSQPCDCGSPDCESSRPQEEDETPSLDSIISDAVESGVEKAMKKITAKFDLTPKPVKVKTPKKAVDSAEKTV